MSERARALEQAEQIIRGHNDFCVGHVDDHAPWCSCAPEGTPLCRPCAKLQEAIADALLAVEPPPSGASPQAETSAHVRALTVHICEDCLNLRGEMCNEPGCRFCRRTMAEVAEYLDVLLIRPRIDGVSVLVDEGTALPTSVSPVEPEPPKTWSLEIINRTGVRVEPEPPTKHVATCETNGHIYGHTGACVFCGAPKVEPEPATTCHCLDCEPLTNPGPKPSEDDIDRLEKAAWDSKTDRVLVWYRDRAEMFRQRLRETERAWQIDRKKPTVEPEPCVWRPINATSAWFKASCRADALPFLSVKALDFAGCPYCLAPLKVER